MPARPPPPPKGNKRALGNAGGRFRTVCPEPEELIAIGEDMVEWVKVNKPLHLSAYYTIEKNITDACWDAMLLKPEFQAFYKKAMRLVGMQYLDKTSKIRESAAQRWQRIYFKDLKKEEDEQARFLESLKSETNKDESALQAISKVMDFVNKAQSVESDLSNKSTDSTS